MSALALGTAFYRLDTRAQWFGVLDLYVQSGGTVIDTGRQYGESELVIGRWLHARQAREDTVIVTKCAHGDGMLPADGLEDLITEELTTSLESLQTGYVDIYMLHRDNPEVPVQRIIDRLNAEINDGRVRVLGASNWHYDRIDQANDYARANGMAGFEVVSNNLSLAVPTGPFFPGLVSTDREGELWHKRTRIPLFAWSSQARGFFSGPYGPGMLERASAIQDAFTARMLEVYCTEENFGRLHRAEKLGEHKGGYTATQVALAWLAGKEFPLVPIVGPHTADELSSCIRALSLRLSNREANWLDFGI